MKEAWLFLASDGNSAAVKTQTAKMNTIAVEQAWFATFYRALHMSATSKRIKTDIQAQNAVPYLYSYAPTGK
jgi:peptide/nickel transport system substrate-binding protein